MGVGWGGMEAECKVNFVARTSLELEVATGSHGRLDVLLQYGRFPHWDFCTHHDTHLPRLT